MNLSNRLSLTILLASILAVPVACANSAPTTPPAASPAPAATTANPAPQAPVATTTAPTSAATTASVTAATYNGGQITDEQLMQEAKSSLVKPLSQIYSIKMNVLQNLLAEEILAKEAKTQNISSEELMKKNATSKIKEPAEAELKALFDAEKGNRLLQGKQYEEVKDILKKLFKSEQSDDLSQAYIESLFKKYNVAIQLERPKADISTDDDPGIGNPKAPIVLIEFSDFQCPYCKKTRPTLDRLMAEYKDKLYYVFRDFPLSFHKQAPDAAHAVNCAGEQKKYWEYNRELWDKQAQIKDGLPTLKAAAEKVGLNIEKFDACMTSKKFVAEIDKDQADGAKAGVTGTPAYFINGIFINGAQPYEAFKEIVDSELKRLNK